MMKLLPLCYHREGICAKASTGKLQVGGLKGTCGCINLGFGILKAQLGPHGPPTRRPVLMTPLSKVGGRPCPGLSGQGRPGQCFLPCSAVGTHACMRGHLTPIPLAPHETE